MPPTAPPSSTQHAVVLFDGVCNLCNGAVLFIIRRDRAGYFRFAALDSGPALALLAATPHTAPLPDSIVLVENGQTHLKSTAALRIARKLAFPWPLFWAFILIPRPIRDCLYSIIARHRYRWFGRRDECMVPTPELRDRFLA
ncbi:MAG: thiol-disulfide oxidoreductase DCC family protein [Planctomycetes bacterium]|nr:thiol-disulfide oxidoreductase DCC family protein [Planctomycetota bacterium]